MAPKVTSGCVSTERDSFKNLTRKHIAERQRRARINKLLEQLESLVTPPAMEGQVNAMRLEKAEVLEKTVEFITKTKSNKRSEQGRNPGYRNGYMECLREIANFMDRMGLAISQKTQMESYLLTQINKTGAVNGGSPDPTNFQGMFPISSPDVSPTGSFGHNAFQSNQSPCLFPGDSPCSQSSSSSHEDLTRLANLSPDGESTKLSPVFPGGLLPVDATNSAFHAFAVQASSNSPMAIAYHPSAARKIEFKSVDANKLSTDPLSAALNISSYTSPVSTSALQASYYIHGHGLPMQDGSVWRPW